MPTGDSYQQNMAHVHIFNFHHSAIAYHLFIQCEQMVVSGFLKHDINKQKCLNKGPGGCEGLYVEGKGSSGIFDMTSSLLNSVHFLKLVLEITFKGRGVHVPHLPQGTRYNWGSLGESPHPTSLARFHPMARPPWGFNTSWTTFGLRHALFTTVLRQTPFYIAALGHLVFQRLPPVLKGGLFTKLGSMICPFVSCISCSTSCDVTD